MEVILKPKAQKALEYITFYVNSINTPGSGDRFAKHFLEFVRTFALENASYGKCHNEQLRKRDFSCIIFNKWVIAFKIENGKFRIYEIILGSLLK